MNAKIISLVAVIVLFSGVFVAVASDASQGANPTTITDGTGKTFTYSEPTQHIVTMGYASTLTVAMLGEIDKIVATDTYSTYSYTNDPRLADLSAANLGSMYSSANNSTIVTTLVQMVGDGKLSLNDTIVLTSYSNAVTLRDGPDGLAEKGFTHVLIYGIPSSPITSYTQIVNFVKDMSIIVTGSISPIVDNMGATKTAVDEGLANTTEKTPALFVWYNQSSGFSVGNTGSIAVSLIDAAGGVNIAYDQSNSATTYGNESTIVQLMADNPNTVIFLQDTYIKGGKTVSDFRQDVLGGEESIKIVVVNSNWNNYDPDAADGLIAFASALHPDQFGGNDDTGDGSSSSNLALYAVAGIIAVIVILGCAYFFMRIP